MKEYRRVRHAANTAVPDCEGCSDLLGDAAADGPAAWTPEAPWARPRVTPAPSPAAKKPGMEVSSSPDSSRREE